MRAEEWAALIGVACLAIVPFWYGPGPSLPKPEPIMHERTDDGVLPFLLDVGSYPVEAPEPLVVWALTPLWR